MAKLQNIETGSIYNPFTELVMIDAVERAQQLQRPIYVVIEGEKGLFRVSPKGDCQSINGVGKVRKKRVVHIYEPVKNFSAVDKKRNKKLRSGEDYD